MERMTLTSLALADKLDTELVNGPRDDDLDWDAILWRPVEEDVRRLRRRIFKASQEGAGARQSRVLGP